VKYIKTLLGHNRFLLLLAITWTILIAVLCLDESSNLPSIAINNIDKAVHFCFHFILTLLWFLYLLSEKNIQSRFKIKWIAFLISFIYGVLIEWAQQKFTNSRKADVFDVCANTCGALLAIFILNYTLKKAKNLKS
jgi:VanZ family protein